MFWQLARFEARYQAGNLIFGIAAAALFALTVAGMVTEDIRFGSGREVHENAPVAIAAGHLVLSIFFIFIPAAFVSSVVLRDDETGFGPIIRSTRVSKFDYLIGRFTGAFAAAAVAFLAVPLAIWLGSMIPGIDPETLGGNRLSAYVFAYFALALPNIFVVSASFFALATITRSTLGTFLGLIAFLILYTSSFAVTAGLPHLRGFFALCEPFGLAAFQDATRYWTAAESNSQMPRLEGALLSNRVIWSSVGLALLGLTRRAYSFTTRSRKRASPVAEKTAAATSPSTAGVQLPKGRFDPFTARAQLLARTRLEMKQVFGSPGFVILIALGLFSTIALLSSGGVLFGTPSIPVTRHMVMWLSGPFNVVTLIIAIYYAGELVWRDRDRKFHEILDATPLPNWAYVVPKTLAVFLVLLSTTLIGVSTAIAMQLLDGYTHLELGKYFIWYILPQSLSMMLVAALAVFIQSLSANKFVGWGIMVLYLIAKSVAAELGFEHNLYLYGNSPEFVPSDLNGLGSHWVASWVFGIYWAAFALLLLVVAHLLWHRGTERRLRPRLQRAPARLRRTTGAITAAALTIFIGAGAYAYYNTNVLNDYRTSAEEDRFLAEYEKRYLQYETLPQPSISHVQLNVALYPEETRAVTRGRYTLTNLSAQTIRDVHVRNASRKLEVLGLDLPGARLVSHDSEFGYCIYTLDQPMAPGETRELTFETRRWQRGFRNSDQDVRLVGNGTFLNARDLMPAIGMSRAGLLENSATRRKHGLAPDLQMAALEDLSATGKNQMGGGWSSADITVSTAADQTPIAPGKKISDVVENGRRTARFTSDAPILTFFSIQSARYAEKHRHHAGVDLAIYFHVTHHWNVDRMLDALQASLDYYQANFGPYQFDQARIIEFPAYAKVAQAFANTIAYSEAVGFAADVSDAGGVDYVTKVTAHEFAHQWWAHQVIGADMQGSSVLTETLAQYSALMVMKQLYGAHKVRQFLKFELDGYLTGRAHEAAEELPLMRVEKQPYIFYQKGSLAMYLLQERLGEEAVNRALRRLIERFKFAGAPYPRSVDLIGLLRQEAATAEQQELITDLFERITLYDLKVRAAKAIQQTDGRWAVRVTVEGHKFYAAGTGGQREVPLNEKIEIGLFTADPGQPNFDSSRAILMERHPLGSGSQVLSFNTERKPSHVGVDPYNFYIDRNSGDNVVPVP